MADTDLCVIGGGAAGMTAAICAARRNMRVTVIEHRERIGKKMLSTGNGRCNLSNVSVSPADYPIGDPAWMKSVLSRCDADTAAGFFQSIGVPLTEEDGRLYPRTMQAHTVLDALRFEIARRGIRTETSTEIICAEKRGDSFYLRTKDGRDLTCGALLFTPGGLAAPKSGSDGSANHLIEGFGHTIRPQLPALVPLVTDAKYRKALSGLRMDADASLLIGGRQVRRERGQVQFTDYGLSGIPIFQLSAQASLALSQKKRVIVSLDLLPDLSIQEIEDELWDRLHRFAHDEIQTMLNGFLPKKMVITLCRICGIRPSQRPDALFPEPEADPAMPLPGQLAQLPHLCKALYQNVTAVKGFDMAQTSTGGVPSEELTDRMASKIVPGLFFAGEITDVCGGCGGYNLHWAWASGMAAADAAADYIGK